jgi:hypothetical protein
MTLHDNSRFAPSDYGVVTGTVTSSGVASQAGAAWSEVPADATGANAIAGYAGGISEAAGGFRFADDFVVPENARWRIDKVVFFAYHTSPTGTQLLPFTGMNMRVTRGAASDPASATVYGDTSTNRLTSATPTNCFRVFNTVVGPFPAAPEYTRNIVRIEVSTPGLSLVSGTYWLDWQYADAVPVAEVFAPPVTHPGMRGVDGANAVQYRPLSLAGGGVWIPLVDPGKPASAPDVAQDLPFLVIGTPLCVADLDLDGMVDLADFFRFLNGFDSSTADGDVNTDGVVDLEDFFLFLNLFQESCP